MVQDPPLWARWTILASAPQIQKERERAPLSAVSFAYRPRGVTDMIQTPPGAAYLNAGNGTVLQLTLSPDVLTTALFVPKLIPLPPPQPPPNRSGGGWHFHCSIPINSASHSIQQTVIDTYIVPVTVLGIEETAENKFPPCTECFGSG